ncbi:unnamed protein product [Diatraea saccharalis]|uniref:Anticodon-binding domain-containing protein n=1 Tax=Diatraea saccharalis TaxID=40085 RepID=A0A9N9WEL3_9NEOP|nr:unnamed protein product [Diatraea saccharalis]
MMDAYGAHAHEQCARALYGDLAAAIGRIFDKLQLPVYRVEAPAGDMGGSVSHEWQLRACAGEDRLRVCADCGHARLALPSTGGGERCPRCGGHTDTLNSIEVGHTFMLGARYSRPLLAAYTAPGGGSEPLHMTCYGIGITRLLAAGVEALSSESHLRWPAHVAPCSAVLVGPKEGSKEWLSHSDMIEQVYRQLDAVPALRGDVLVDDRHHLTIGKRLLMADRLGCPLVVVLGKSVSSGQVEVYRAGADGQLQPELMTLEQLTQKPLAVVN